MLFATHHAFAAADATGGVNGVLMLELTDPPPLQGSSGANFMAGGTARVVGKVPVAVLAITTFLEIIDAFYRGKGQNAIGRTFAAESALDRVNLVYHFA